MQITSGLAQPIIHRLSEIITAPLNIINHDGIVVASDDRSRLGTFHQGAIEAMKKQDILLVYPSESEHLEGTRAGITMPLVFHGEQVGALGISGDPDALKETAQIICVAVLSLMEQAYRDQRQANRNRVQDNWVANLISERAGDQRRLVEQAALLDIDLGLSASIILVEAQPTEHTEFAVLERFLTEIVYSTGSLLFNAYAGMGRFVLAVAAQLGSDDARLARLGENLYTYLKDEVPACYIAMGTPGHGINGYRNSYSDALQGIRILQRLATNKHIMHYNEYQMFRLLEYLPDKARESFRVSYLGFSEMDSKLALTLTTYFDSDLSPAITACTLGIHRNTLAYRLNRIKQQYGLDPYRFHDAVALQMLLYMQDSSK